MATRHTHSSGAVLTLEDGSTVHSVTNFEQEISVHPVTAKPINSVTALSAEIIVLAPDGTRRRTKLTPMPDGTVIRTDTTEAPREG